MNQNLRDRNGITEVNVCQRSHPWFETPGWVVIQVVYRDAASQDQHVDVMGRKGWSVWIAGDFKIDPVTVFYRGMTKKNRELDFKEILASLPSKNGIPKSIISG